MLKPLLRWQLRHLWVRVSSFPSGAVGKKPETRATRATSAANAPLGICAAEKYEFSFISAARRFRL